MYPKNKDTSPSKLEKNGAYELVLVRCLTAYRIKYAKDGLTMVFKELESGEEIIRTISIPNQSVKEMTFQSVANNFINLILQGEDSLELRQDPKLLAEKMTVYGGGRIFKGVIVKNERGFMDLISIGEEGRQR
ncbi:MAG: hypothetical protein ACHQYQ_10390 [Bacteriovoracales bacterium]